MALAEVKRFSVFEITEAGERGEVVEAEADQLNSDMSMGMFKIRYTGRNTARFSLKGIGATVSSDASSFAYA